MKYNVHTHIFNSKCIPENFLGKGIVKKLLNPALSFWTVYGLNYVSRFITQNVKKIAGKNEYWGDKSEFLSKYSNFLAAGRERSQEQVFRHLFNTSVYEAETKFVVLTMDFEFMGCGKCLINYPTQLSQIVNLKIVYPDKLFPFIAVDPRRGTADQLLDMVKLHIEKHGFIGIKLYPALGFYPYDPRLYKVYEFAEKNQIPIMTHCTKSGIFYKGVLQKDQLHPLNMNPNPINKTKTNYSKTELELKNFKLNFSNPNNYKDVLEVFPNLKICIAHFGGSREMMSDLKNSEQKKNADPENWYNIIKDLITGYKCVTGKNEGVICNNVYTDISYTLSEKKVFDRLIADMNSEKYGHKIMFGTDYYMTTVEKPEEKLVQDFFDKLDINQIEKISNTNVENYLKSNFYHSYTTTTNTAIADANTISAV